jgi:hypothetical protein
MAGFYENSKEPSGFHKIRGISRLCEELLASQKGLCSRELGIVLQLVKKFPVCHEARSFITCSQEIKTELSLAREIQTSSN